MDSYYFTSESVTEGHPDKMCDQISDAILDAIMMEDPEGRVACETIATTGLIFVTGEITTRYIVDIPKIVREVVRDIGYEDSKYGFDYNTCAVITSIDRQSADIALGVDSSIEEKAGCGVKEEAIGAGDQGMMFGYACNETPEMMPLSIVLAHKLAKRLSQVRKQGLIPYLRPDGKSQVTLQYEDGKPKRIDTVIISAQHATEVENERIEKDIKEYVVSNVLPEYLVDDDTKVLINPTGRFCVGGPQGDSGLTGRKIIVDTYGGHGRHGGGCFSGKDPTKVDRSAAYAARYAAKNVVAAGVAAKCEIQLAYSIGKAKPVSVTINTFGTGKCADEVIKKAINEVFDFRPAAIIDELDLRKPIYRRLAAYGHMGREELGVKWESIDKVAKIQECIRKLIGK